MIRLALFIALAACLQGCAPRTPARTIGQPDSLCLDDCLGAGGTREFCERRCTD